MPLRKNDIINYDFKKGLALEFQVTSLTDLYTESSSLITIPHRAAFYHIIWFQKGKCIHTVDFHQIEIEDNSLLFLNKDIVHSYDIKPGTEGKVILFTISFYGKTESDVQFLNQNILFNDLFTVTAIKLSSDVVVFESLLILMEKESKVTNDSYQKDILRDLLHNFILQAERLRRKHDFKKIETSTDLNYVFLLKELMDKNFKINRQVGFYASELDITERRLSLATSNVLGKTAKQIIDDRVLRKLSACLSTLTHPLKKSRMNSDSKNQPTL